MVATAGQLRAATRIAQSEELPSKQIVIDFKTSKRRHDFLKCALRRNYKYICRFHFPNDFHPTKKYSRLVMSMLPIAQYTCSEGANRP